MIIQYTEDENDLKIKKVRKDHGAESISTYEDNHNDNFIYRKSERGMEKIYFSTYDMISSLKHKPPKYMIKMNNKVIPNQLMSNIKGNTIELTPTQSGGS